MVKYAYDAWGYHKIVEDTSGINLGTLNPIRYRSYFYDTETKLCYLKSRYYDPEIGRFINADDVSYLDPETINGLNLYAYCFNNPIMLTDSSGRGPIWDWFKTNIFQPIGQFANDFGSWISNGFNTVEGWLNSAWNWTVNTALPAIGNFFANSWEYIVGGLAILAGVILALPGAIFGALAGFVYGVISGGNIFESMLVGATIGAGTINPISAGLIAAGGSLITDRIKGNRGNLFKAVLVGAVSGALAQFSKWLPSFLKSSIDSFGGPIINAIVGGQIKILEWIWNTIIK